MPCSSYVMDAIPCWVAELALGAFMTKWGLRCHTELKSLYKFSVLLYAELCTFLVFLCLYLAESGKTCFDVVLKTLQYLYLRLPYPLLTNCTIQRNKNKNIPGWGFCLFVLFVGFSRFRSSCLCPVGVCCL